MSNRRPWRTRRCCHNGRHKNKTHKNNIQSAGAAPPPSSTIGQQKKTFSTAELTITMNTNLPEENSLQTKQIKLTGDMLDVKGAEGRGPYFTPDVRYKDGSKVFSGLTQKEKVAIFFDQRKFNNFIQQCYINRKERDSDEYQTLVVNALEPPSLMHRNFAESNIMFMLSQIIKISYPQITEVSESYQGNIYSPNLFEQFLRYGINTYLKIGGKDYTITKARWQNDFYSHPEYFDLYTKYDKYTKWYDTNKENLISNLEPAFGIYFKPNIDKTYVYDRNIIEYVLAAIAEDFLPLDIVKKKMANISVPLLNDDKVNISARTYGATDSFSEYKMRLDLIDEKKKKDKENIETEKKQARENLKEFIEKTLLEHSSGSGDFPAEASYNKHLNKKRNFYNKILNGNTESDESTPPPPTDESTQQDGIKQNIDELKKQNNVLIENVKDINKNIRNDTTPKGVGQDEISKIETKIKNINSQILNLEIKQKNYENKLNELDNAMTKEKYNAFIKKLEDIRKKKYKNDDLYNFLTIEYEERFLLKTSYEIGNQKRTSLEDEVRISKQTSYTSRSSAESVKEGELSDFNAFITRAYELISQNTQWQDFEKIKKAKLADIKKNTYNRRLRELLENLSKIADYRDEIIAQKFYVGVEKEGANYKIVLYVDLVGGKITLGNSGKISCEYKSNKLGNELKNLWDNEDFERARFFVDLTQNIKVADAALPAPPPPPQAPRPPPPPPMGGGGWFTRRRRAPLKLI